MTGSTGIKKKYVLLGIVAVAIIAGYVFYRIKKGAFLNQQLGELVQKKTNGLYNISYDSIHVNEADGNVFIKNLSVKGDTARQLEMLRSGDTNAVKMLIDAYIPELKIEHFKTARALLSKQLICRSVIITNPRVNIFVFPGQTKTGDFRKQQQEFYKQILGNLDLIKADSIAIVNGEVTTSDFFTKEIKFHTLHTSAWLTEVAIDSTYSEDTSRTLFCKEIKVTSGKVILGDKNNTAEASGLSFDTQTQEVRLAAFQYDAFKNKGFFKGKVEGVSLKGLVWNGAMENSDLAVEEAVINSGEIETQAAVAGVKIKKPLPKPILTGWISRFSLHSFKIKSLLFVRKNAGEKAGILQVKNNQLTLRNFSIDRDATLDENLIKKAGDISYSNDLISLTSADNLYEYRFSGLKVNSGTKRISARSIRIIPKLNETDFARKAQVQKDRYDITLNNVECQGADIEALLRGEINIDNLSTSNNSIKVFHDRTYPIDSASKEGIQDRYPQQMLHKLKIPLNIRSFSARKTTIEYKEKNPESQSSGKVRFTDADILVKNISNYNPKAGEKIDLHFRGNLLGKIPVNAVITFYADEWRRGKFSMEARTLTSFEAATLNELLQPLSLARMDKGVIETFHFNITADTAVSHGSLDLAYHDLKISLMKKKGNGYGKKSVISFLANVLVKNSNDQGPNMRKGKIEMRPDKYKSFFNFIWKSVFSGAKQVLVFKI